MTGEDAGVGGAVVDDGRGSILGDDVDIEIYQALATDAGIGASHAVRGVTGRTAEAGVDVALVLSEAGVGHDVAQTVALAAERVGAVHAEIGIAK